VHAGVEGNSRSMICPYCQSPLGPGAAFCGNCGEPLGPAPSFGAPSPAPAVAHPVARPLPPPQQQPAYTLRRPSAAPARASGGRSVYLLVLIALVGGATALILIGVLLGHDSSNSLQPYYDNSTGTTSTAGPRFIALLVSAWSAGVTFCLAGLGASSFRPLARLLGRSIQATSALGFLLVLAVIASPRVAVDHPGLGKVIGTLVIASVAGAYCSWVLTDGDDRPDCGQAVAVVSGVAAGAVALAAAIICYLIDTAGSNSSDPFQSQSGSWSGLVRLFIALYVLAFAGAFLRMLLLRLERQSGG